MTTRPEPPRAPATAAALPSGSSEPTGAAELPHTPVQLTGYLRCATEAEAATVRLYLPRHIELTRAEPGCMRFDVEPTDDPLVWTVHEEFASRSAFEAHQKRVQESEWGTVTAGIRRDYTLS